MKAVLVGTILLSTASVWAQSISGSELKTILTGNQRTIEAVYSGISKTVVSEASVEDCSYTITSVQTILKVELEKIIVLADEKFKPTESAACTAAGFTAYQEKILFFTDRPTLAADLAAVDEARATSITQVGNIITLVTSEAVTLKYDLTKPSFRNLISVTASRYKETTTDSSDINPSSFDLSKVLFCDNNDGDISECVEGDYSDVLF